MTTERNKALVRRWIEEVWGGGNLAAIRDLFAPGYTVNGAHIGPEGVRESVEALRVAFPEAALAIADLVAEGDRVVLRWTLTGEHRGAFLGVPPTGRRVAFAGINIYRIAGGSIAANDEVADIAGLIRQLGSIPPTA